MPRSSDDLAVAGGPDWGDAAAERADELAGMAAQEWVRVVIHPERVQRVVN